MAFKDGGMVKKITPPPPAPDRPALGGYHAPDAGGPGGHYFGTKPGTAASPTSPMPGPGDESEISLVPDNFENVQESQ